METRNARGSRHGDGDQDTETFKAEIIPRTWISFGRTGSDLFVNKHQELSVTGYNERGSFVPLLLDLWQAQLPGIRYFQAFPKSSNHRAKKHGIPGCLLPGQGKAIPMGYSSNGTEKETVTQGLSLPGHGGGTSGKGLSSATFEPWNISRFPLESF